MDCLHDCLLGWSVPGRLGRRGRGRWRHSGQRDRCRRWRSCGPFV